MTEAMDRMRRKYEHDAAFHAFVDMMRHASKSLALEPGELREAAVFATYLDVMYCQEPIRIPVTPPAKEQGPRCPQCGGIDATHPRLGIRHVCPEPTPAKEDGK